MLRRGCKNAANGQGVRENGGNLVTSRALDIHEVRVWVLDQVLQLVLALLNFGVQKVADE